MAGMSRMDRREPQFLEARGEMTSAYDWLATGGEKDTQSGGHPL